MVLALSSLQIMAQKAPHEFSVYACGGVSTYSFHPRAVNYTESLGYATDFGSQFHQSTRKENSSIGFSSDFGFGFTGFLSQQIGIHTSAGFGLLNVKSKRTLSYVKEGIMIDIHDRFYELHTKLENYTEIHKTLFVSIPLMLQFQTKQKQYWNWTRTQKAGFYAQAGVKVHFLFGNKYEVNVDSLFNAGYYFDFNNWAATQKFAEYGFGPFEGNNAAGKLDFGVMVLFACEAGVKWRIDNNIFVYTGAFFDCGLNDPVKNSRQPQENFTSQQQLSDLTLLRFSDKINLMMVGIKLRMAFTRRQGYY
jgi:hypothetical protein